MDAEVTNPRPAENITEKPKSVEVKKNVHDAKKDVSKRKRAIYVEIKRTPEIQVTGNFNHCMICILYMDYDGLIFHKILKRNQHFW